MEEMAEVCTAICEKGRIVDISFGPAYLLSQLSDDNELHGLDYNETMVKRAKTKDDETK